MIRLRYGQVLKIEEKRPGLVEAVVAAEGSQARALVYPALTGPVREGDSVLLNTTAVALGLGTGGYHFVMAVCPGGEMDLSGPGHIVKLGYTPGQVKVLAVEESAHPRHELYLKARSLEGMPVVIGSLHSMVAPAASVLHYLSGGRLRIVYLMTDAAALPLWFSDTVADLRGKGIISATVTCGHAFGGDLEAVNVHSGLLAARSVARADVVIAAMGPGVVGTGTHYGHSALEQGQIVDAVNQLGGKPIAQVRLSFTETRARHRGVSHHSLTALGEIALTRCQVAVPFLPSAYLKMVMAQLRANGITRRHRVRLVDAKVVPVALACYGIIGNTMGRGLAQEPYFFQAAGAAGILAAEYLGIRTTGAELKGLQ